jgi:hypothetical protein
MPKGHKNFTMRGGVDHNAFPQREVSLKEVRSVSRIAWEKWGMMVADMPLRDLLGLAYAEGLWHGAMIALRNPDLVAANTIGTMQGLASSAVESVASSKTTAIEMLSVKDLLESL